MRISILTILLAIPGVTHAETQGHSAGENQDQGLVPLVVSPRASSPEQVAASELGDYLGRLYPQLRWQVVHRVPEAATSVIRIGTPNSAPELMQYLGEKQLHGSESYVVTTTNIDKKSTGIILGADPAGVMYGTYSLLEKLGFGFYLSFETTPQAKREPFDFDGWNLTDRPLTKQRIVFNWHNFLSGCTGWDLEHWKQWIAQSQKMGYNTVMVHAYGNNPMFTYAFHGMKKQVGYVATSKRGRDWGNQHINDVRRIPGGEIFAAVEFGSEAAVVPEERRIVSKQEMMKQVFAYAEARSMCVCFALDIDIESMLPQDMICSLAEKDRFRNGRIWLPRPDTQGGYPFYRAQAEALLTLYPQIDIVALWRRSHAAEWGALKKAEQLPLEWKREYLAHIRQRPDAANLPQAVCSFALNKVVGAFRRAFNEIGRSDVGIGMGSWGHAWVPALSEFLSDEVTIMPLDSSYLRYRAGSFLYREDDFSALRRARGRIVPIIWAHHDDGEYIGRPIHPHVNFNDTLKKLDARGYGIIHWMTRPLDPYFKNHSRQVWERTENEPYRQTCMTMARHCFGPSQADLFGRYLYQWAMEAPLFGRVTSDHFFLGAEGIPNPESAIQQCRRRIAMLDGADLDTLRPEHQQWVGYFRALENLLISFCQVQELMMNPAQKALNGGKYTKARTLLQRYHPSDTIRQFSRLSQLAGPNRGEEAMVLSLATRWLTDYLALRQAAGLEAIRINYGPTRFEPTAQGSGRYTFYIDAEGKYWSVRGEHETQQPATKYNACAAEGDPVAYTEPIREIAQTSVLIDSSASFAVSPIVNVQKELAPGAYRLTIYVAHTEDYSGRFDVSITTRRRDTSDCSFDPVQGRFLRLVCRGNNRNAWNSIEELACQAMDEGGTIQASDSASGYTPEYACDGKPQTRWAAEGRGHWIQFPLKPNIRFDQIKIRWYREHDRQYDYDLLISVDGKDWSKIALLDQAHPRLVQDHIDLTKRGDLQTGVSSVSYPVRLPGPDQVDVTLSPKEGTICLLGIVLQPDSH